MLQNPIAAFLRKILPKNLLRQAYYLFYSVFIILFTPLNYLIAIFRRDIKYPGSVLHISYPVHTPFFTVKALRRKGLHANYLAVNGIDPMWHQYDYYFLQPAMPWTEILFFWKVVAKYEIIHTHFGITMSESKWEVPILKFMGRKILVNYRGCEARDRAKNMALHPQMNICQECDHNGSICRKGRKTVELYKKYGDLFLVTTPDMRDFIPEARHFRFFAPEVDYDDYKSMPSRAVHGGPFKLVHVTNHPGIEGSHYIEEAVNRLKTQGYDINYVFLRGVTHDEVLHEISDADVTIGKMKMGYYANQQIESMFLGVPSITYVRPEFMSAEIENSALIFSDLEHLEQTIASLIDHPEILAEKRKIARDSVKRLHNNDELSDELISYYRQLGLKD